VRKVITSGQWGNLADIEAGVSNVGGVRASGPDPAWGLISSYLTALGGVLHGMDRRLESMERHLRVQLSADVEAGVREGGGMEEDHHEDEGEE